MGIIFLHNVKVENCYLIIVVYYLFIYYRKTSTATAQWHFPFIFMYIQFNAHIITGMGKLIHVTKILLMI